MTLTEKILNNQEKNRNSILSEEKRTDIVSLLKTSTDNWLEFKKTLDNYIKELETLKTQNQIKEVCFKFDNNEEDIYVLTTPQDIYNFKLCACFDDYDFDAIKPYFVPLFWLDTKMGNLDIDFLANISESFRDFEQIANNTFSLKGYTTVSSDGFFDEDGKFIISLGDGIELIKELNNKSSIVFKQITADIEKHILAFYENK